MMIETKTTKDGLLLVHPAAFEPEQIVNSGQCFRWEKTGENSYTGVAMGRVLTLIKRHDGILFQNVTQQEFDTVWRAYFDLDFDYVGLQKEYEKDPILRRALTACGGIRILRQDLWECLISFILSANNNIPRIKGIIDRLSTALGEEIPGTGRFAFPRPEALCSASCEALESLRAGYRTDYIVSAAQAVSTGFLDLAELPQLSYEEARARLLAMRGVGAKVAECTLLFGAGMKHAFPVDVWIRRALKGLYQADMPEKELGRFAEKKFGKFRGVAQQYLFYTLQGGYYGRKEEL